MTEPIVIELNKTGHFDGVTALNLTRDDFTESGKRYYRKDLSGSAGVIGADLFGLFQPYALKLVGLAGVSHNPQSTVKLVAPYGGGKIRQEFQLSPEVQYLVMSPNDRLVVNTAETTERVQLLLVANEMSEADHVRFAARASFLPPTLGGAANRRRFQLYHAAGEAFAAGSGTWIPTFTFDPASGKLVSTEVVSGSIPCTALSRRGPHESIYVRVRFANITAANGSVTLYDGEQSVGRIFQSGLDPMEWSRVFVMGFDDKLGLTGGPEAGSVAVDIDVVHSLPGEHLSRRWEAAL